MSTPRILVTGAGGQLAQCLADISGHMDAEWVFASRAMLDIADQAQCEELFNAQSFDFCINTAAYTKVDLAEQEQEEAFLINATAPAQLARLCAQHECVLIHFSTDYVYDNDLRRPLREDDPLSPQSVYARSKHAGEVRVLQEHPASLILRTSWVFSEYSHNFVRTMARLMRENKSLRVVNDQYGCPTYAGDLAKAISHIIRRFQDPAHRQFGVFNYCNSGETNWFEFAKVIASHLGLTPDLSPVTTADYGAAASRPAYSVLDTTKIKTTFGVDTPPWEDSLARIIVRV